MLNGFGGTIKMPFLGNPKWGNGPNFFLPENVYEIKQTRMLNRGIGNGQDS